MSMSYADSRSCQCAGKIPHRRSREAKDAAIHTMTSGGRALMAYHCAWCGAWHCGHRSEFKAARYRRQIETGVL